MNQQNRNKIGIFGGTHEGRLLAEFCQDNDIDFAVSVATAYGEQLLEDTAIFRDNRQIGRMNAQEMAHWIRQEQITDVVDATHPFAQAVSLEIRSACTITQVNYLRLLREASNTEAFPLSWTSSFKEAAAQLRHELLQHPEKKALLTVGSKEIACFAAEKTLLPRIFVRVLPSIEAIKACQEAGFRGKQIIAMQGPFSSELNKALIHTVQASYLVTKESGKAGGFEEKIKAAHECGCKVIAVQRPEEPEKGQSLEEIKQWLTGKKHTAIHRKNTVKHQREFVLLGIGTGNTGQITWDGIQALIRADALLGAARMVESTKTICRQLSAGEKNRLFHLDFHLERKQECITYQKEEMLSWLADHPEIMYPVILFSGDTGFYSGAKGIDELLKARFPSASLRRLPGISSLSYFAAKIGRPWEKAEVISLHGREETLDWSFSDKKERFFLLDGEERLYQICQSLLKNGRENATLWAGENLSYPTEKITCGTPEKLLNLPFGKLLVAWVSPGEIKDRE